MQTRNIQIGDSKVSYYFDASFSYLEELLSKERTVIITDENVYTAHQQKFSDWKTIVIKPGEEYKQQSTVDDIIHQLIAFEADRKTFIIGVGGGVVTDIAGYVASVYMRGLRFAFVPTTLLAMADASIGGKNGIDVGIYKNLVGLIRQPEFLLFDYSFLDALPTAQWVNGFAEVIKHACIKDADLFALLEAKSLESFRSDRKALGELIERNTNIKTTIVVKDEFETGDRMLLNFGHTLGHAIENNYKLLHGHAVSIGMVAACAISEEINDLHSADKERVIKLLTKYELPVKFDFDKKKIWEVLKMDKKRVKNEMSFILLNKIGDAVVKPIPIVQLEDLINQSL